MEGLVRGCRGRARGYPGARAAPVETRTRRRSAACQAPPAATSPSPFHRPRCKPHPAQQPRTRRRRARWAPAWASRARRGSAWLVGRGGGGAGVPVGEGVPHSDCGCGQAWRREGRCVGAAGQARGGGLSALAVGRRRPRRPGGPWGGVDTLSTVSAPCRPRVTAPCRCVRVASAPPPYPAHPRARRRRPGAPGPGTAWSAAHDPTLFPRALPSTFPLPSPAAPPSPRGALKKPVGHHTHGLHSAAGQAAGLLPPHYASNRHGAAGPDVWPALRGTWETGRRRGAGWEEAGLPAAGGPRMPPPPALHAPHTPSPPRPGPRIVA